MTFGQSAFRVLIPDVTHGAGEETVDLFLTVEANVPVRLSTASVDMASPEQTLTPVMTYDFFDFERRPPPEDAFRMKVRAVLGYPSVLRLPGFWGALFDIMVCTASEQRASVALTGPGAPSNDMPLCAGLFELSHL